MQPDTPQLEIPLVDVSISGGGTRAVDLNPFREKLGTRTPPDAYWLSLFISGFLDIQNNIGWWCNFIAFNEQLGWLLTDRGVGDPWPKGGPEPIDESVLSAFLAGTVEWPKSRRFIDESIVAMIPDHYTIAGLELAVGAWICGCNQYGERAFQYERDATMTSIAIQLAWYGELIYA